jgi:hypothetical protein
VHDLFGNTLVELGAYLPFQVSAKLYGAVETLPKKLQMKVVPHFTVWPKQFETDLPNFEDIGVYFLPLERRYAFLILATNGVAPGGTESIMICYQSGLIFCWH